MSCYVSSHLKYEIKFSEILLETFLSKNITNYEGICYLKKSMSPRTRYSNMSKFHTLITIICKNWKSNSSFYDDMTCE